LKKKINGNTGSPLAVKKELNTGLSKTEE